MSAATTMTAVTQVVIAISSMAIGDAIDSRMYAIGPVPASNTARVAPANMKPDSRVVPPTR